MNIVAALRSRAEMSAKAMQLMAQSKSARNQAAGDVSASYDAGTREQTIEWRAADEIERLRSVLDATHKLVTEGALTGFTPTEGTWAERLYNNQGAVHDALKQK